MRICRLPHAFWNPTPARRELLFGAEDLMQLGYLTYTFDSIEAPQKLLEPHHVFTCGVYDLFEQPKEFIDRVVAVMRQTPRHEFQIETSRPDRIRTIKAEWASNIWVGTQVSNSADVERVDELRRSPAQVKFLRLRGRASVLDGVDLTGLAWVQVDDPRNVTTDLEQRCSDAGLRLFAGPPEVAEQVSGPPQLGEHRGVTSLPERG